MGASFHGPANNLRGFGARGTEIIPFRPDSDPVKVQAIGVPASLNRNVAVGATIRVVLTGGDKQLKFEIGEMKVVLTEKAGPLRRPETVPVIAPFIDPAGIVKNRK